MIINSSIALLETMNQSAPENKIEFSVEEHLSGSYVLEEFSDKEN